MFDPENPFIIDPILLAESCNGLFTNQLDKGNSGGNRVDGDLTAGQGEWRASSTPRIT